MVLNTSVNFNTQTAASQATNLGNWIDTWRASNGGHGCVIVALHTARWSTTFSGATDNGPTWVTGVTPIWGAAIAHHVDLWLQGHVHAYEEFEKLDDQGNDSSAGIKAFTVGSGGRGQQTGGWSNIATSKRLDYHASAVNGVLSSRSTTARSATSSSRPARPPRRPPPSLATCRERHVAHRPCASRRGP